MSLSDVRSALMANFASISANVYTFAPEAVMPPAILCYPSDPYIEITTIGPATRGNIRLEVVAAVAMNDNQASLINCETLVEDILAAIPSGYLATSVSGASKIQVGPSDLLTMTITVEVTATL